jgi:activator of HSP90 ATPase
MAKTIQQNVKFADSTARQLFNIYTSSKKHSDATGGAATITKKVGEKFTAWDGYIKGKNLHVVSGKTVVQTWRASDWPKGAADSILILNFDDVEGGAEIRLVQVRFPEEEFKGLSQGWRDHYWKPMKNYLKAGGK